jgi:hypothetical protein
MTTDGDPDTDVTVTAHSVDHHSGFYSVSDDGGWIPYDPFNRIWFVYQPTFRGYNSGGNFNFFLDLAHVYGIIPNRVQDYCLGSNVLLTDTVPPNSYFTMDNRTFEASGQPTDVGGFGPILELGGHFARFV